MKINRDYSCNPANYQRGRTGPVKYLVIHYVGGLGGARANARYYGGTPGIGASAHYFVGHGPEAGIWASVAESDTAWHCGRKDGKYIHPSCRNANSIGVELCCRQDGNGGWYFDVETVNAAVELCRDIMRRYGITVDRVLRHYDVTGKRCPRPWVVDREAWEGFKHRLAEDDMTRDEVRAEINAAVRASQPRVYTGIDRVPEWARDLVRRAIVAGAVQGDGTGRLNLVDQDLKTLSMLDGLGALKGGVV